MSDVAIDADASAIVAVNMAQQSGTPATPGVGHRKMYAKSDGWYDLNAAGDVAFIGPSYPASCRYTTAAGQTIPDDTDTPVNFDTVDYDPDSAVTIGGSWIFTAPSAGLYTVDAHAIFDSFTPGDGTFLTLNLYKNGTIHSNLHYTTFTPAATIAMYHSLGGSDTVKLTAGDTLTVYIKQTSGSDQMLLADATYNHVAITKVG